MHNFTEELEALHTKATWLNYEASLINLKATTQDADARAYIQAQLDAHRQLAKDLGHDVEH